METSSKKTPKAMGDLLNFGYVSLFIFNIILLFVIRMVLNSENISSSETYGYVLTAGLLMTLSLLYALKTTMNMLTVSIMLVVLVAFMSIMYQFDLKTSSVHEQAFRYTTYIIGSLSILVGLAMISNSVIRHFSNSTGITGFIVNFIFFLPCLIGDFTEFVKNEFNLTPPVVYILFAFEMLLLLTLVAISYIPKLTTNLGGKPIINEAIFLDSKYLFKNVNPDLETKDIMHEETNHNYAISLWTFVNQRNSSNTNLNIFAYGSDGSWKPKMEFVTTKDDYKDKFRDTYRVTVGPEPTSSYIIEVPSQIWNNFVFNYNGDGVDLFINGVLERSVKCMPKYNDATDQFITGEASGLYGAICNVTYYDTPLSQYEITSSYNLLNGRNPPINNI
jgi:hypothetical protein